ncbi:MAG: hypothetical protein OXU77_17820 [Gammaproteobacteria bacterium]|nr:hypothetical protein [Gammaproteobacteria bacterium]MDE0435520.1 hypothetical protein [Bryobacterales bacterium]
MGPAQTIVIDDEPHHLVGLADTLNRHDMPCRQILFSGNIEGVDAFPDARLIFADLHLGTGVIGSDHRTDFSTIGSLLEGAIKPVGRYGIVLWTLYPDQAPRLEEFLRERLEGVEKPVGVWPLAKPPHLDEDRIRDEGNLIDEIRRAVDQLEVLINKPDAAEVEATLARLFNQPEDGPNETLASSVPGLDVRLDDWMDEDLSSLGATPRAILRGDDAGKLFLLQRVVHSIATLRAVSHPHVVRDIVRHRIEDMYRQGVSMELVEGPDVGEERTAPGLAHWMDTENPLFGHCTPRQFFEADQVDVMRLRGISARLDAVDDGAFT